MIVEFTSLRSNCNPNGNMTVLFTAQTKEPLLFGLSFSQIYKITNSSKLIFRQCSSGELLVDGDCIICTNSSYSLNYSPYNLLCDRCPSQAERCYGDTISLQPGYWRRTSTSDNIFECPMGENACKGNRYMLKIFSKTNFFHLFSNLNRG